jgi:hypothetical protein
MFKYVNGCITSFHSFSKSSFADGIMKVRAEEFVSIDDLYLELGLEQESLISDVIHDDFNDTTHAFTVAAETEKKSLQKSDVLATVAFESSCREFVLVVDYYGKWCLIQVPNPNPKHNPNPNPNPDPNPYTG